MSLYTHGMRIAVAKRSQNYIWYKTGDNVKYGRSHVLRRKHIDPAQVRYFYKLSFTFEFELPKSRSNQVTDKIFFAYCFPYTFTKLINFLKEIQIDYKECDYYEEGILCKTLSGVEVPLLTITSRVKSDP